MLFSNWTPNSVKLLEEFKSSDQVVGFSDPKVARIEMKTGAFDFGLLNLGQLGIIGMDLLEN